MIPKEVETVPCEFCGKPTPMLYTKRCDPCWELEKRIQAAPEIAKQILARIPAPAGEHPDPYDITGNPRTWA